MVEIKVDYNIEIEVMHEVAERINWLTRNYDKEISAWLTGKTEKGKIIIDGLLFPKQEVSGASVDTDTSALIKLKKEYGAKCKRIIGHWHSHNDMSSYWSATDNDFIKEFIEQRKFALFMVSSRRDGIRTRIDVNDPLHLTLDELPIIVKYENTKLEKEMLKVIKDKIIIPPPKKEITTTQKTFFPQDQPSKNHMKKRIRKHWAYDNNNHILKISGINYYSGEGMFAKFRTLSPQLINGKTDKGYTIIFDFKNKKISRKNLSEIREYFKRILLEEDELFKMAGGKEEELF